VQITEGLICGGLSLAAVRRAAMIMDIRASLYNFWQKPFVNVACRKIGRSVIACFVRIVELETERLGQLVVCEASVSTKNTGG
jgi:hypothetical protein